MYVCVFSQSSPHHVATFALSFVNCILQADEQRMVEEMGTLQNRLMEAVEETRQKEKLRRQLVCHGCLSHVHLNCVCPDNVCLLFVCVHSIVLMGAW